MAAKILLVEDEEAHRLIIKKALGQGNYDVDVAENFEQAVTKMSQDSYDLFLLDIMLPDRDGYELCAHIKSHDQLQDVPIIFLTSKSEVHSKVLGFTLGADDYIVKPCDPLELRARVDSKLKKYIAGKDKDQQLILGDMVFDLARQAVDLRRDGETTNLEFTPLEFKLLYYMAKHKDHVLSRNQILDAVWGSSTNVLDRSVDTYIAAVRKKLGEYSRCIRSVHGVGYKFSVESVTKRQAS